MKITRNKNGTFNLGEVSLGKLMAIVNSIDKCPGQLTTLQIEVRDLIRNNYDYKAFKKYLVH